MGKICKVYETFGTCQFGSECINGHPTKNSEIQKDLLLTEIFTATVEKVVDRIILIKRINDDRSETYFLPNTSWHRLDADKGDLVIFQKSAKIYRSQYNIGRIITILSKSCGHNFKVDPHLVQAFTLDTEGTRRHDDAVSIEICQQRKENKEKCTKIGIHIIADFTCTHPIYKVGHSIGFSKKNICLALSIYFHTTCSQSAGEPTFTLVQISEEYSFRKFPKKEFGILWSYFMNTKSLHRDRHFIASRLRDIEDWKVNMLVGKLMHRYNQCAKKYVGGNVITKRTAIATDKWKNCDNSLIVPQDIYHESRSVISKKNVCVEKLAPFLATSDLFLSIEPTQSTRMVVKYHRDVKLASDLLEDDIVDFTSPLRKGLSKINQQILINSLFSPRSFLYSRDDLLGLICDRYKTPHLADAVITNVGAINFSVSYIFNNVKHNLFNSKPTKKIRYGELHYNMKVKTENGKTIVFLNDVNCSPDSYFNQKYVNLNRNNIDEILEDWENEKFSEKIKQFFEGQKSQPESILYPYNNNGSDTLFTVASNFRLKLQVSEYDVGKNDELSLRLISIGTNCHLCLTHIKNPELAFMSNRTDINALGIMEKIEFLNRALTNGRKPSILRLQNVQVSWDSKFYSGGSFISLKPFGVGNLLCIRQDISECGTIQYVWVAHAVVKEIASDKVLFSVCTLSQDVDSSESQYFSVEVIQIPQCRQPKVENERS